MPIIHAQWPHANAGSVKFINTGSNKWEIPLKGFSKRAKQKSVSQCGAICYLSKISFLVST